MQRSIAIDCANHGLDTLGDGSMSRVENVLANMARLDIRPLGCHVGNVPDSMVVRPLTSRKMSLVP